MAVTHEQLEAALAIVEAAAHASESAAPEVAPAEPVVVPAAVEPVGAPAVAAVVGVAPAAATGVVPTSSAHVARLRELADAIDAVPATAHGTSDHELHAHIRGEIAKLMDNARKAGTI